MGAVGVCGFKSSCWDRCVVRPRRQSFTNWDSSLLLLLVLVVVVQVVCKVDQGGVATLLLWGEGTTRVKISTLSCSSFLQIKRYLAFNCLFSVSQDILIFSFLNCNQKLALHLNLSAQVLSIQYSPYQVLLMQIQLFIIMIFPREKIEEGWSCAWQSTLMRKRQIEQHPRRESSEFKDQFYIAGILDRC